MSPHMPWLALSPVLFQDHFCWAITSGPHVNSIQWVYPGIKITFFTSQLIITISCVNQLISCALFMEFFNAMLYFMALPRSKPHLPHCFTIPVSSAYLIQTLFHFTFPTINRIYWIVYSRTLRPTASNKHIFALVKLFTIPLHIISIHYVNVSTIRQYHQKVTTYCSHSLLSSSCAQRPLLLDYISLDSYVNSIQWVYHGIIQIFISIFFLIFVSAFSLIHPSSIQTNRRYQYQLISLPHLVIGIHFIPFIPTNVFSHGPLLLDSFKLDSSVNSIQWVYPWHKS